MKTKRDKTIWQAACDYETERRGGMATIFNYLASLHPMTDEAEAGLADAWQRYGEQMNGMPSH